MEHELNQSMVWGLVLGLKDHSVIRARWVYHIRTFIALQGYHNKNAYSEETFTPMTRLETIRVLLTFVS